jgi:hypothetical protein
MEEFIIKDFPNYTITKNGQVFSKRSNRFIKHALNYKKFETITLKNSSGVKTIELHKLLADMFLEKPNGYCRYKFELIHVNGNKLDNRLENLSIVKKIKINSMKLLPLFCGSCKDKNGIYKNHYFRVSIYENNNRRLKNFRIKNTNDYDSICDSLSEASVYLAIQRSIFNE